MLARIPQLQRLMETPHAQALCCAFRREDAVVAIRREIAGVRRGLLAGKATLPDFLSAEFFTPVRESLVRQQRASLGRVINATGVVLHTNLGRAPLAPEALDAIDAAAAGYANLEFDLDSGERGTRYAHVEALLCRLTGAEAALVVNNCAAAVLLALMALAAPGEVIVSRGELIEIGGAFRMPEVIAQSGARLVEVGTTNKTRLADYANAIGPDTRMILKSHPSNYRIVGFAAQPERRALGELARERGLAFVEDLGSGTLVDLRRFGLPHEPTVQECVAEGGAGGLVTFSGDKLLGGPQAGIVVGGAAEMARLKAHPLLRALRIDKLSLAALEATLRLYEAPEPAECSVPALRMLAEERPSIARRARRLAKRLSALPGVRCATRDGTSLVGGGSLPGTGVPTCLVTLEVARDGAALSADDLARRLRAQRPAVIGRIVDDRVALDLRTVAARDLPDIVRAVGGACA
ncbi:MAG: L-seryl-tRNA(Sec) selenium transferase [Burkholderiaceae bacterium]